MYARYRYRLKYGFDIDFLSFKLYPEYKKSNIQIVSKIQIQIEIQFWYRFFICQIVSRKQEIQYTDCIQDTDTDWNTVLIQIFYPSEYKKSNVQIVSKIQIQINIEIQFWYRIFIHQIVSRIQEIQYTDCIQDTDTDTNSFDTDLSIKLYLEYKKSNIHIVSKIQIQIEIQFWYRFICQIVSRIQEIQYTDCIQDTDTDWNTVQIQIFYLSNCIQNTRNPIYRLYPRYRFTLKYSFDTDFLSIRIQEIQCTDCIQDTDTDTHWNTVLIQIFYPSNCIQNTRNPIYRLYPRYRYRYK